MTDTISDHALDTRMASIDDENGLRELYFELDSERDARIDALESQSDVADIEEIVDAMRRVVDEVHRRRDEDSRRLAERVAAVTAPDPARELPPERPKRPKARWVLWPSGLRA